MIGSLYHFAAAAADPFRRMLVSVAVRHDAVERSERLGKYAGPFPETPVWVHAASAGETEGAAPVVAELVRRNVVAPVVFSSMTRAGRKRAERLDDVRSIYLPVDLPGAVRAAFDTIRPALLILVETEIWPTLIREANRRDVPVVLLNGRLSRAACRRMGMARSLYSDALRRIAFIGAQREVDAERFLSFGVPVDRVAVHGSTKIDALDVSLVDPPFAKRPGEKWVVFGSVRRKEEAAVLEAADSIVAAGEKMRVAVAPRHPARTSPPDTGQWRPWSAAKPDGESRRVWIDTMGDLVPFYSIADVAFIGGTLSNHGGHNPAEPARFAVPVLFGPHVENCAEFADLLLAAGAASTVRSGAELAEAALRLLGDEAERRRQGNAGKDAIEAGRGATLRCVDLLEKSVTLPRAEKRR